MRRNARLPARGSGQTDPYFGGLITPGFLLVRGNKENRETFPSGRAPSPSMPELDGSFGFDGVPPGTWDLYMDMKSQDGAYADGVVASVTLRAGETTKVDVDLSRFAPVELEGQVLRNGKPLADATLNVVRSRDGSVVDSWRVDTDAEGRFHQRRAPGTFRVWESRLLADGVQFHLAAAETVDGAPGSKVNQTFHITTGLMRVHLVDAQGQPAAGVALTLHDTAGCLQHELLQTDAAGAVACELEAETFVVHVLPKRLQDPQAQNKFLLASLDRPDPFVSVRVRLGAIIVKAGEENDITLRLPAEWDR